MSRLNIAIALFLNDRVSSKAVSRCYLNPQCVNVGCYQLQNKIVFKKTQFKYLPELRLNCAQSFGDSVKEGKWHHQSSIPSCLSVTFWPLPLATLIRHWLSVKPWFTFQWRFTSIRSRLYWAIHQANQIRLNLVKTLCFEIWRKRSQPKRTA